jgi:hypothetical protein
MKRFVLFFILLFSVATNAAPRWSAEQANRRYSRQPWIVGANFIPSTAINQLEMWQADSGMQPGGEAADLSSKTWPLLCVVRGG